MKEREPAFEETTTLIKRAFRRNGARTFYCKLQKMDEKEKKTNYAVTSFIRCVSSFPGHVNEEEWTRKRGGVSPKKERKRGD